MMTSSMWYADTENPYYYAKKGDYLIQVNIEDLPKHATKTLTYTRLVLPRDERLHLADLMEEAYEKYMKTQ